MPKIGLFFVLALLTVLVVTGIGFRIHAMLDTLPQSIHKPKRSGYWDYQGKVHWHTRYSKDCTGTYQDIANITNRQHIDFMISTEHDNINALLAHKEGIYGKTLILTGVEITRPHPLLHRNSFLLGISLNGYKDKRSDTTDKILSNIQAQDGMAFIAHPRNPRWAWEEKVSNRISGMEILDKTDEWFTAPITDIIPGAIFYSFSPRLGFLQLFHRPVTTLSFWDNITRKRRFVGIYAPDFHQAVHLPFGIVWRFPKAKDIIPIAHDHIVTRTAFNGVFKHDKAVLYTALRAGNVYVALDGLADATGFMFTASRGQKRVWMGGGFKSSADTFFKVTLPNKSALKNIQISVYHNGKVIEHIDHTNTYSFTASLSGAYRVEVSAGLPMFFGGYRKVVWIYSNPIYIGE